MAFAICPVTSDESDSEAKVQVSGECLTRDVRFIPCDF